MTEVEAQAAQVHEPIVIPELDQSHLTKIELADDQVILADMNGHVVDKYMYSFKGEGGKVVEGLTTAGVNFACREFARSGEVIRLVKDSLERKTDPENPDYYIVSIFAERVLVDLDAGRSVVLDNHIGLKRQWKNMKVTTKWSPEGRPIEFKEVPDLFFAEKAVAKAERNAKKGLIPEAVVLELMKMIRDGKATAMSGKPISKLAAKKTEAKPAATAASPAKPSEAQPAAQAVTPPDPAKLARDLNDLMKAQVPDLADRKAAWKSVSGLDSMTKAPADVIAKVTGYLQGGCLLRKGPDGAWRLLNMDGDTILMGPPVPQVAAAPPPAGNDEQMF